MNKSQESPKELELIAATVHELKTPLTLIHGTGSMLASGAHGRLNKRQLEQIHQIQKAGRRLSLLIDSLLHVESLPYQQRLQPTQLQGILLSVIDEFSTESAERKVSISFTTKTLPPVLANPASVYQLLQHLITTVIRHAKPASEVILKVRRNRNRVVLSIRIPGDFLRSREAKNIAAVVGKHLQPVRSHSNSAGLSLYIVKSIVEFYRGELRVSARGGSTVITAWLPISQQLSLFSEQ